MITGSSSVASFRENLTNSLSTILLNDILLYIVNALVNMLPTMSVVKTIHPVFIVRDPKLSSLIGFY